MRLFAIASGLILTACNAHGRDEANKCGISEAQLQQGIEEVSRMRPYTGKRVGRCELIVDDGGEVSVATPEDQQRVEEMIAREKAESKN